MNENKIKLNYTGIYFRPGYFGIRQLFGAQVPMLVTDSKQEERHCAEYFVLYKDKAQKSGYGIRDRTGGGLYLSDGAFIFITKGSKGFVFEHKLFECNIKKEGGETVIDITELNDDELCDKLWEIITQDRVTIEDKYTETTLNETIPANYNKTGTNRRRRCKYRYLDGSYAEGVDTVIRKIGETRFLDVSPDDNKHIHMRVDTGDEYYSGYTILAADGDSIQPQKDPLYLTGQGFTPFEYKGQNAEDIGAVALPVSRYGDYVIAKPVEIMHDLDLDFWLKLRIEYRYPLDTEKIAKAYPAFLEAIADKKEPWRGVTDVLPEAPAPFKLGDAEMFVPCEFIKGEYKPAENKPFSFTHDDYGIVFAAYGGKEYFAVYRNNGETRFKKDVYARYTFTRFVPLESILSKDISGMDYLEETLYRLYILHTNVYGLAPEAIEKETFDDLDTAPPAADEPDKDELSLEYADNRFGDEDYLFEDLEDFE